jgi:hypothetical protein
MPAPVAIEDPSALTDAQFNSKVLELLKLLKGLEGGNITCACRRVYTLGITKELKAILPVLLAAALARNGNAEPSTDPESTSRFSLIEV